MERIRFPSAVTAVVGALNAQLPSLGYTGVPVRTKVPNPRPARFVLVRLTGGPRVNLVTRAVQLTIEAWSTSDTDAEDLAETASAIVSGLRGTVTGGVTIYGVDDFAGPGFLPDPDSEQSRFTFTKSVSVRGVAA